MGLLASAYSVFVLILFSNNMNKRVCNWEGVVGSSTHRSVTVEHRGKRVTAASPRGGRNTVPFRRSGKHQIKPKIAI